MPAQQPDVSIIIVNYNTFDLTSQCIESVIEKTSCSYEIIVIDNASTDVPAEALAKRFPQIILVCNSSNLGFSKANNIGIERARGKFILLLNSDTRLQNDAVEIVRNFLTEHPGVAVATGKLTYPDGRIQHNCQRFPSIRYGLFELLRLQKIFKASSGKILFGSFFDHNTIAYPDWVWGTFFMFHRDRLSVFHNARLPDDFFLYVEDMLWCKEFRSHNWSVGFTPEARITHYLGKSGGNRPALMTRNLEIFIKTYYNSLHRFFISVITFMLR